MDRNIGRLDRTRFAKAHSDTVFVRPLFPDFEADAF